MRKVCSLILIFAAAFVLTMSAGAVYAMSFGYPAWKTCYAAYFCEGAETLKDCELLLDIGSPENARYGVRYYLSNDSGKPTVVKVMQPVRYDGSGSVTVGCKGVVPYVRHSYIDSSYDIEQSATSISDEFIKTDYDRFTPDKAVYKSVYKITELGAPRAAACFTYRNFGAADLVFCDAYTHEETQDELKGYVSIYPNAEVVVYQIGQKVLPDITFYRNTWDREPVFGKAELIGEEELTFGKLVDIFNDGTASEADYYNAVVRSFYLTDKFHGDYDLDLYSQGHLMEWRCLDIPLEAGEQAVIEVEGVFPPVDDGADGCSYEFILHRSFPASVNVKIDSPSEVNSAYDLQQIGDGQYAFTVDDADDGIDVYVDYGENEIPAEFVKFLVEFFGRIVALPVAIVGALLITRGRRRKSSNNGVNTDCG